METPQAFMVANVASSQSDPFKIENAGIPRAAA
jgi:hypothetical protein